MLLDGLALVEYVDVDGKLYALTLVSETLALHELDPNVTKELEWLRFAYGRLAAGRLTADQRAANRRNAETSAAALETGLLSPLLQTIGDAPLVIVPTGALHALPWGALPALRATVLTGKTATAEATLAALDGAALAHLACHGHFRADSPLFSSLELADGPLNVYELQNLRRAPEIVVLSACDLALSQLHPGDELLGLAAALLGMGTRTVVASVVPVPDAESRRVMLDFHRELASGSRPAEALAHAQARARMPGFVCLGSA